MKATFIYNGMPDYWSGNSRRWDEDAGCLFAYYDGSTTLRKLIDGWVEDFGCGGDCDSFPADVTAEDVRQALVDMLSPQGWQDQQDGAVAECAVEFAAHNPDWEADEYHDSPVAIVLLEL